MLSATVVVSSVLILASLSGSWANCPNGILQQGISGDERNVIVNEHNNFRIRIANGKVGGQPRGVNLKRMSWDDCLAREAQRIANSCNFGHQTASCREVSVMLDKTCTSQNRPQQAGAVIGGGPSRHGPMSIPFINLVADFLEQPVTTHRLFGLIQTGLGVDLHISEQMTNLHSRNYMFATTVPRLTTPLATRCRCHLPPAIVINRHYYKYPSERCNRQDHTSQDHFCNIVSYSEREADSVRVLIYEDSDESSMIVLLWIRPQAMGTRQSEWSFYSINCNSFSFLISRRIGPIIKLLLNKFKVFMHQRI
ncbi:unnamed protein product [Brassicogethes aeneus]|uniref:SCP domain-containing protein n=1 Tax=Brassicogethes aeneus TaxID=1431903 RepID=A0A9P0FJU0_BRAAE|nr:unnamed protein product [Brassicogethes aeneus]